MAIHYRCRCGQEVVLRPREGIYMVVGLLVGLTLLNSVLTLLLLLRDPERTTSARESKPTPSAGPPVTTTELTPQERSGDPMPRAEPPSSAPREAAPAPPTREAAAAADPVARGERLDDAPAGPPSSVDRKPPEPSVGNPSVARVAGPGREFPFAPPPGVDGLTLAALLADPPADPLDRTLVRWVGSQWGSGGVRAAARSQLRAVPQRQALHRRWLQATPVDGVVTIDDEGEDRSREFLERLTARWPDRIPGLVEGFGSGTRAWIQAVREELPLGARDFLVLVDLTESMRPDLEAITGALREIVPLTLSCDASRRWGWIAYRDEVIGSRPLTSDGGAFLDSLSRWECGDGGDVPEGVDRALFEALRFGSFEWSAKGRRVLLVLGDAPPPYERIRGMVSLVEAAHESPEGYVVHCLGILREPRFETVPGFRELARAGGGRHRFLRDPEHIAASFWGLLVGPGSSWNERPFP